MHMAVEIIEQKDPKLFKEMMDRVGRYDLFDRVMAEYQNNPFYQREGKPNVRKIKKEAIGKILAQTVIDKNEGATEKPELLNQTRTWWQRIVDFLKSLFLQAQFNPFETAASQVLRGQVEGIPTGTPFASRNSNAVSATMKLVQSLRDTRAEKWFNSLYKKGQPVVFFNKLQQDLQAPKNQVDMLKTWMRSNNPDSVGDMIVGILAELSYAIEIQTTTEPANRELLVLEDDTRFTDETGRQYYAMAEVDREGNALGFEYQYFVPGEGDVKITKEEFDEARQKLIGKPTQYYSDLNVLGGTNYTENEIRTPQITPSIKGHSQFVTDNGIGWTRTDERKWNEQAALNYLISSGKIEKDC